MKKKRLKLILGCCLLGLIILLVLSIIKSFSPNPPIYYRYNNVIVTRLDRIDGEAETHFFYGYYNGKSHPYPKSYIKATYHGIDGSMIGYLIFLPNNKIGVVDLAGWFEKVGVDSSINIKDFTINGSVDNGLYIKWHDSINGNYRNVIYFQDEDTAREKTNNRENHSDVKVEYSH